MKHKQDQNGSIPRNQSRLPNIAMPNEEKPDYQESVTTRQTDRQTPDKVIPMCRYASQAKQQKLFSPKEHKNFLPFSKLINIRTIRMVMMLFLFLNLNLPITMETLTIYTIQTQVTSQVISPEIQKILDY